MIACRTKKEIAELQGSIPLTQEAETLTARFGSAAVVLKLSADYPQPYARVLVVRIDGVEKAVSDAIKASINGAPIVPLKQVIAAVHERLERGGRRR